ncbi:MAG: ABC transporter ATP-binding protein/permease [Treponema sp.]|nr:ABC transporter ATP-binding protein/permease [Treponema sp.]
MADNKLVKTRFIYIGRMFRLFWNHDKIYLFLRIFQIILTSVLPFIGMNLTRYSINLLTAGAAYASYVPVVLFFLGLTFAHAVLAVVSGYFCDIRGNTFGNVLLKNIFQKTVELDYDMLLDKNIMEKRERAMNVADSGKMINLVGNFLSFVSNAVIIGGIVYIISSMDLWILGLVLIIITINSLATQARKKAERVTYIEQVPVTRRNKYFHTVITDPSIGKEIRVYNMLGSLTGIYGDLMKKLVIQLKLILALYTKGNIIHHATTLCLNAAVYCYLGYKILVLHTLSIGDFSMYLMAITSFNSAVQGMTASFLDISNNGQYLKDYFDYMKLESRFQKGGKPLPVSENGELVFTLEKVCFKYPYQENHSLKNVSLTITNKERLSIVGENGAGKTTLIKLLMRLYEPTEGRILLNGVDIRELDYEQYLNLFSTVFQDFKLFAFRIADNITSLSGGTVDHEKIKSCLVKAGLDEKIASLEKGLDTYLYKLYEEDGVELSGGESQKLAIARALYKDAPVVILDEPTAALDPRAEYEIYTKFFEMVDNKTSLFITHRLSSTRFCDRIVALKNGEIVESGTHEALLAQNGYYAELFNMQAQFYTDNAADNAVSVDNAEDFRH